MLRLCSAWEERHTLYEQHLADMTRARMHVVLSYFHIICHFRVNSLYMLSREVDEYINKSVLENQNDDPGGSPLPVTAGYRLLPGLRRPQSQLCWWRTPAAFSLVGVNIQSCQAVQAPGKRFPLKSSNIIYYFQNLAYSQALGVPRDPRFFPEEFGSSRAQRRHKRDVVVSRMGEQVTSMAVGVYRQVGRFSVIQPS